MLKKLMLAALCLMLGACGSSREGVDKIERVAELRPFIKPEKGEIEMVGAVEGESGLRLYRFRDAQLECLLMAGADSRGSVSCVQRRSQ